MRILILTPQLPYPPHQGTTIRNFNLIAQLARRHTLDLICLGPANCPVSPELARLCQQVTVVLHPPARSIPRRLRDTVLSSLPDMGLRLQSQALLEAIQKALRHSQYDIAQVEGIELAYALPDLLKAPNRPQEIVFDDHNAEYVLQQRAFLTDVRRPLRWPGAAYSFVQWRKLCGYEAGACRAADRVVVCSEADRVALERLLPGLPVWVVPNGVDLVTYNRGHVQPITLSQPSLVFTGKMDFRPNIDGVTWFAAEVWPQIRQRLPQASFAIVGQSPHSRIQALHGQAGIQVTGAVPDVRPYLAAADLVVIPLRIGGGTRLKVMEAMAMARPVLSTRLGAEGFPVQDGREIALADSPAAFAQRACDLLSNAQERERLGIAGRNFVEAHYGWEQIVLGMEEVYAGRV